jgi:2-polyprenyl-3-methyl-5-hydroxy-6-metoxy-1,4-benzoquinol methylase
MAQAENLGAGSDEDVELETLDRCDVCHSRALEQADATNRICRCQHCGYVFVNPRPTQREIVEFYSRSTQYDPWLDEEGARRALWMRRLRIVLKCRHSGSLLDVGTGTGQFLAVARRFFEVHGTEVSESGVRIARERYGLNVSHGELGSIGFGCKFDVVTVFHVLEHVPSPSSTLEACRELMKDDGVLIIAVPNDIHKLRSVARRGLAGLGLRRFRTPRFQGVNRMKLNGTQRELHLSHFTPSVLRNLLLRCGFGVSAVTLDPYYVVNEARAETKARRRYCGYLLLRTVLGINLYEAMLVVARPVRRLHPLNANIGADATRHASPRSERRVVQKRTQIV